VKKGRAAVAVAVAVRFNFFWKSFKGISTRPESSARQATTQIHAKSISMAKHGGVLARLRMATGVKTQIERI
jgi:hypothetical protein